MVEINCINCRIGKFKDELCENCESMKALGDGKDVEDILIRNRWIPVSERLPEDGEICLVCGKNGGMYVARIDRHGFWTRTGTGKFVTPIAWQKLPKPYEVEEE